VEKAHQRVQSLLQKWPDKISGQPIPTLYTYIAEPPAAQKAKEIKVWLTENRKEKVTLEEILPPSPQPRPHGVEKNETPQPSTTASEDLRPSPAAEIRRGPRGG